MNVKSLRFRLTIWYSLVFFIGTAVIFVIFYLVTKQTLLGQTDQELRVHANALIRIVENNQSEMTTNIFNQEVISQQFSEMPGMLVVITNATGKITAVSQQGAENNQVITDLLQKTLMVIKPVFVDRTIGSTTLRIGIFPIVKNGNLQGLVLMGDPVEAIYRSLNSLFLSLLAVNLLFFIPAFIGGHIFARKAMEPILDISDKLAKITSENLNERVIVPQTKDELEELALSFNLLLDRINEAFKRERQFIGDVAHELKTPLSIIRSGVEIALSRSRSISEYKKSLQEVLVDTNRLSATLNNVLNLAWSESQHTDQIVEVVNLSQSLEELRDIAVKLASPKHILVKSMILPEVNVLGKSDKLGQAILNLIDNAVKFTPQDGCITLSLSLSKNRAVVKIKDSGIGVSEPDLPHIFERFYRGAKAEKILGSGLGLAITASIIHAHHGEISVKSQIEHGSVFTVSLPLIKSS